jgi:hypothetical protein
VPGSICLSVSLKSKRHNKKGKKRGKKEREGTAHSVLLSFSFCVTLSFLFTHLYAHSQLLFSSIFNLQNVALSHRKEDIYDTVSFLLHQSVLTHSSSVSVSATVSPWLRNAAGLRAVLAPPQAAQQESRADAFLQLTSDCAPVLQRDSQR